MRALVVVAMLAASACADGAGPAATSEPAPTISPADDTEPNSTFATSDDGLLTVVVPESSSATPTVTTIGRSVATDGTIVVAYEVGPADASFDGPVLLDVRLVDFESGDGFAAFHTAPSSSMRQLAVDRIEYGADAARVVADAPGVGTVQIASIPAEASQDAAIVTAIDGVVGAGDAQVVVELLRDERSTVSGGWIDLRTPSGDRLEPLRSAAIEPKRAVFAVPCDVEGDHVLSTTITIDASPDVLLFEPALIGEVPDRLVIARSERSMVDCVVMSPDEGEEGTWIAVECSPQDCSTDFPGVPIEIEPSGSALSIDVSPLVAWLAGSGQSAIVGFGGEFGWRVAGGAVECRFDSSVLVGPDGSVARVDLPAENNACTSSTGVTPFPYAPIVDGDRVIHDATTLVNTMNFVLRGVIPPTEPTGGDAVVIVEAEGSRATDPGLSFGVVPGSRDGSVPPDGWTAASWVSEGLS